MRSDSPCPICKHHQWSIIGSKTWLAGQKPASEYASKRLTVLFDVWFPGHDQVELKSSLCTCCGFVTNIPRVERSDIDAKYHKLAELGQDYGQGESSAVQLSRSQRLLKHCAPYLPRKARVLDFGGGDGRLMAAFSTAGHECFLIDYNESPKPYVTRLASTLEKLGQSEPFDIIICSHVLEHVADPVETLKHLRELGQPKSIVFVEVPMEIWRRPPLQSEPVTHVNFFVPGSLARTFEEAGLEVVNCCLTTYVHPSGRSLPCVVAIGRNMGNTVDTGVSGANQVRRYLQPGIVECLNRAWITRRNSIEKFRYRLRRMARNRGLA